MVKITYKVNGLDKLERKVNKIIQELPKRVSQSIEDVLKEMKITAVRLEKGNNEEGIICELVDMSRNEVKGRIVAKPESFISNGVSYLWFEYFGTGQYAEENHVGKTEHFIKSGYSEWFIPVSKVEKPLNYPIVTINEIQFYIARGVKANRFLQDAEFKTRDRNIETVKKNLDNFFKEVCK